MSDPHDRVPAARTSGDLPVTDAATAAATVADDAVVLVSGFGRAGYPKAVPEALAADGRDRSLTVVSGGSVGEEIDGALVEAGKVARRFPFQAAAPAREAINAGEVAFHDAHVSRLGDEVETGAYGDPDVAVIEAVAVGEDWLVPSASVGHTPTYVRAADRLVVELNDAQPLALAAFHDAFTRDLPPDRAPLALDGPAARLAGPRVRFDTGKLDAVVRTDRPDDPYEFREPTDVDEAIAANLADFLAREVERNPALGDPPRLQVGVGSLGNALMGALGDGDLGPVTYFGEVVQDGLLDAIDAGAVTAASATSLALSREGRDRLFSDAGRYADSVVVRSADVSNAPALVDRFGVVAVNSALEVDLYGHANATHLRGTHLVSGIGGGGDFSRASAVGVVALASTAAGGDVSRVVPMASHVDHTAHDVSVVVTERGVADLRGLGGRERAREMTAVAHPDFREELRAYRDRAEAGGGALPHDHGTALDRYG